MPSVLYGTIVHRFELPCPETKSRGKRTTVSDNKRDTQSLHKDEECLVDNSRKQRHHCGFVFIPESKTKPQKEYLVSLPKRLLKPVCHAIRLGRKVAIKRFTEIPILESSSTSNGNDGSLSTLSSASALQYSMIEVFDLEIISLGIPAVATKSKKRPRNDTSICIKERVDNLWTLAQFWRKEQLDYQKMKNSRPKFSLVATVDAISPIVTLDPSNPFVLIEVYDRENTNVTCVVVLHGKQAMVNHAAIHPLDTLTFRDVVYKPWSVHKLLQGNKNDKGLDGSTINRQFLGRIPSHVFVATRADSICWDEERSTTSIPEGRSTIPPIITPVNLVTSIKGKILGVKTRSISYGCSKATVIQYLEIILMNHSNEGIDSSDKNPSSQSRCRLYLSHFPMSMTLQYSLRRGAVILASNLHLLHSQKRVCADNDIDNMLMTAYGACLRSTLILLRHATDDIISLAEETTQMEGMNHSIPSFETQSRELSDNSMTTESSISCVGTIHVQPSRRIWSNTSSEGAANFLDYGFRNIRQTYLQDLYLEYVKRWEERGFRKPAMGYRDAAVNNVPTKWLVDVLLSNDWSTENKIHDRGSVSKRANQKTSTRSPYAEFFDHSFSSSLNNDAINVEDLSSSCRLSMGDRKNTSSHFSGLLDLDWIRDASQTYFENHVVGNKNANQSYQLRKGFQGSIRVPLSNLYSQNRKETFNTNEATGHDSESNATYLIGGFVSEIHSPNSSVASIADGVCQIPIAFDKTKCHANVDDFFIGQFDSVIISCLCLGNLTAGNEREHKDKQSSVSKSVLLPALSARDNSLSGNCALVTIGGLLFITAIQMHCCDYQLLKMTKNPSDAQEDKELNEMSLKVENCLAKRDWVTESPEPNTVMGMLTRCEFYSKVNTDGPHKCCLLTISSLKRNESKDIESDNSCLQVLELSVSVAQNTARMSKFNEILSNGWSKANLAGSQKALATSFWALAGSGRTCPITFGGSEDFVPGSSGSNSSIKIIFPTSSLQLNKLGYTRSLCSHDFLDVFFESHESNDFARNTSHPSFDFVGGTKTIAGMLHRRPARRTIFRSDIPPFRIIGELATTCSNAIPSNTLSSLFELIFQGLREPNISQSIMNPSLVRRISNSRFLGVSFCKVECYCTRCFSPLTGPSSGTKNKKRMRSNLSDEPSFWHLPHPKETVIGARSVKATGVAAAGLPEHIGSSKFRCPKNDCPKHAFGVRWECSGVLDDGTGQATMYADGDAALTLLGFSAKAIQTIEEGVWSVRDGSIQFLKSIPPPKGLRDKVIDILATQKKDKSAFMVDPLLLLSKQDRATYLLDRHCRSSPRPRRQLDYYVRCKPLVSKGNATPHLHHTTIDFFFEEGTNSTNQASSIHRGQTASYTLPSLKLELVDCGINSHELSCPHFE